MIDNDHGSNDDELRELFSRLRRDEELGTPPFMTASRAASNARRRPLSSPLGRILAGALVCAAMIVATVLWLRHEPVRQVPTLAGVPIATITEWKPPTDFLLNTPGSDILRASPSLELRPYFGAMTSLKQHTARPRKRLSP